ncbi:FeoA family protein [Methanoregula boonei 6A8]|jgi:ferrous iron transport protein A|uniref:FeoA family protein n=1 Tax=Methanoregula boonei (strain DSM 21154 / JCM 14090 / 6A8) TaxID=456442 RepID=A7I6X8_METB6|nr:FeoA family protein [Methanoregula boonei]ABS55489.1 FeoA family protein [Methanoregula boonei 6A8]
MTTVPLSFIPPGSEAAVTAIQATDGLVRRLAAMGLRPESRVTVICADRGSLIVSVAGSRYALSKGMAMKIMVNPDTGGTR